MAMYAVGSQVNTPKGPGEVVNIAGGWTSVMIEGKPVKFRNSNINAPGAVAGNGKVPSMTRKSKPVRKTPAARKAKAPKVKAPRKAKAIDPDSTLSGLEAMRERCREQAGGKPVTAFDNNDTLAKQLRGMPLDEVYAMAKKATGEDYHSQYKHLNAGMQRMNLGNRLRAALRDKPAKAKAKK